jgi:hypothetical protein
MSDYARVVLRVVASSMISDSLKGEVFWSRSAADCGKVDFAIHEDGFSSASIDSFLAKWPMLVGAFEAALVRCKPKQE